MNARDFFRRLFEHFRAARFMNVIRESPFITPETADRIVEALEKAISAFESVLLSAEETLEALSVLYDESLRELDERKRRRAHYASARGDENKRFPRRLWKRRRHNPRWGVAATGQ